MYCSAGHTRKKTPPVSRRGGFGFFQFHLGAVDASSYTYVEVEEKGQKSWVAVMKTAVEKGDIVEFPDSPPMVNFESKTLKKTFDKIIFAEGMRIVK